MKKILAIIRKDLVLRFTSPSEWLFFLILPLVFMFILAGGTPSSGGDNRIRLPVVDAANTPVSAALFAELAKSTAVRPERMPADEAQRLFDDRDVAALLVIPADLSLERLQSGRVDLELRQQPNSLNAQGAQRAVLAAAWKVGSAVKIANAAAAEAQARRPFADPAARQAYFDAALAAAQSGLNQAPPRLEVSLGTTADPVDYDPAANSSAGQMITWVLIPLLAISGLFAFERQQGTLRRLLTTPTSRAIFLLGTLIGQMLTALAQMLLLILFGTLVMNLNWGREPLGLALMMVSFTCAAAALGVTLGTFIKTEGQAGGLSVMIGMVFALMGGCWYPIELFPEFVRTAVRILPTTWAMQGMLDLLMRGAGPLDVLPEAGVLMGFALVFFTVGIWRFRYE